MRLYLDSAYIAKCYFRERGTDAVLDLVERSTVRFSSALAVVEVHAVFHRHFREGKLTQEGCEEAMALFESDRNADRWNWIPITDDLIQRAADQYRRLASGVFLRSADCLHLISARSKEFEEIYSNDRRFLEAAPHFGLVGKDVISGE